MAPKKAYPFYHASAWVNIVSESERRARGGSDGLTAGLLVVWAHLFRGHIIRLSGTTYKKRGLL
jgi:hypothetical protein